MALELNSDKQPFVKINSTKYNLKFPFERNFDLTDLMLFTKGDEPYQHFAKSIFRAIEQNTYLVRSANKGISAIINNKGEIVKKLN